MAFNDVYSNGSVGAANVNLGNGIWIDTLTSVLTKQNVSHDNSGIGINFEKTINSTSYLDLAYNNAGYTGGSFIGNITLSSGNSLNSTGNLVLGDTCGGTGNCVTLNFQDSTAKMSANVIQNVIAASTSGYQFLTSSQVNNPSYYTTTPNFLTNNSFGVAASNFVFLGATGYSTYAAFDTAWCATSGACTSTSTNSLTTAPGLIGGGNYNLKPTANAKAAGLAYTGAAGTGSAYPSLCNGTPDLGALPYPCSVNVPAGTTKTFTSGTSVTWTLSGPGSLSTTGPSTSTVYTAPTGTAANNVMGGCQVMPNDSIFNTPVSGLPVDANSSAKIANMQQFGFIGFQMQPSWGISIADSGTPTTSFKWYYTPSTTVSVPYPSGANLYKESGNGDYLFGWKALGNGSQPDEHTVIVRRSDCSLYEVYDSFSPNTTSICQDGSTTGCNTIGVQTYGSWANTATYAQVQGDTVDLAGGTLAPLTWHVDEIKRGQINHGTRGTLAAGAFTSGATSGQTWLYPATAASNGCYTGLGSCNAPTFGSNGNSTNYVEMGSWLRLKATFSATGVCGSDGASPTAACSISGTGGICTRGTTTQNAYCTTMLTSLQQYGEFIADIGTTNAITISGDLHNDPDVWAAVNMIQNANISSSNFEVVDTVASGIMPQNSSYQSTSNGNLGFVGKYGGITYEGGSQSYVSPTGVIVTGGGTSQTVAVQSIGIGTSWPLVLSGVMSGSGARTIPAWVNPSTVSQTITWTVNGTGCGTVSGSSFTPPTTSVLVIGCSLHGVASADSSGTIDIFYSVLPSSSVVPSLTSGVLRVDSGSSTTTVDGHGNTWQADTGNWGGIGSASPIVGNVAHWTGVWANQYNSMDYGVDTDLKYVFLVAPSTSYVAHVLFGFPDGICTFPCGTWPGAIHNWYLNTFNPTSIEVNGKLVANNFDWGYPAGYAYDQPADIFVPAVSDANGTLEISEVVSAPDVAYTGSGFTVTTAYTGRNMTPAGNGKYTAIGGIELFPDTNAAHITIDLNLGSQVSCGGVLNKAVICAGTTMQPFYAIPWGTTSFTPASTTWSIVSDPTGLASIATNADGSGSLSLASGTPYVQPIIIKATNGSYTAQATVTTSGTKIPIN